LTLPGTNRLLAASFWFDVLLQQFGHDLVLALKFVLKRGDPSLVLLLRCRARLLKSRGPVLEELLLPVVEHRWLDMVLVAKIGNGQALEQVTPQNGNFLDRCIMLAWLFHGRPPIRVIS
jgi:hypothetical protein